MSFQTINTKLTPLFKTLLQIFLKHSLFTELLWFLDIWHWFKETQFIKLYIIHFSLLLSSARSVNKFSWNTSTKKTHLQQNNITVKYDKINDFFNNPSLCLFINSKKFLVFVTIPFTITKRSAVQPTFYRFASPATLFLASTWY